MNIVSKWHPKVALRYLPIVAQIKKINPHGTVLEVGSGSLGIAPYLGRQVTGVDRDFAGPQISLLEKVSADATKLPFAKEAFIFVVAVDVLEHIPRFKREKAIREMIRVAKKGVFIAVPEGKKAQEQDKKLSQIYQRRFGLAFPFFSQHLKYGLPTEEEVRVLIWEAAKKEKKEVTIEREQRLNLFLREFLMKGWMTKNIFVDVIFRKVFLILIPLFLRCNWEPTYRGFYYVKLK